MRFGLGPGRRYMAATRPVTFRFTHGEIARLDALVERLSGGDTQATPTRTQVVMQAIQALEDKIEEDTKPNFSGP